MEEHNSYQKIVPFILFTLALVLLFTFIRPMITILLSSVLLAYISFPIYRRLIKRIPNKPASIIVSLSLVVLIVLIPFSFLAFEVTQQGYYFYDSLSNEIAKGELFGFGCASADSRVCSLLNRAERFSTEKLSAFGIDEKLEKLLPVFEEKIKSFILTIPIIIAQILFTLVISYFIMKEWETILNKLVAILPMSTKATTRLIKEFGSITHTVVYAQLFVALVQGVVATIGFYLFGVPFPIILGVVVAFFSLIPSIGTALIWTPISLLLIAAGYLSGDPLLLWRGIGLFSYGLLLISTIDNILLLYIVHERAKVNQIVVIIGVIGGVSMFGFVGLFIGPILLPLLITYFETFKEQEEYPKSSYT